MATPTPTETTVISDLKQKAKDLLANEHPGIQSAVLYKRAGNKTHLFAIPEGEAFPTHDTPRHATIQVVEGWAKIELGETEIEAGPNAWIYMPPRLPHRLEAITPFAFVLHVEPADDADSTS